MMKTGILVLLLLVIGLSVWWLKFRTPPHDAHYDAAVCAAVDSLGTPASDEDFNDKVRTVILNENSSWSLKQVEYDEALGRTSIARYQALSPEQQREASGNVNRCIDVMAAQR